jgi:hypothetical protein
VGNEPGSSHFHLFSHFHHFTAEPQRLPGTKLLPRKNGILVFLFNASLISKQMTNGLVSKRSGFHLHICKHFQFFVDRNCLTNRDFLARLTQFERKLKNPFIFHIKKKVYIDFTSTYSLGHVIEKGFLKIENVISGNFCWYVKRFFVVSNKKIRIMTTMPFSFYLSRIN